MTAPLSYVRARQAEELAAYEARYAARPKLVRPRRLPEGPPVVSDAALSLLQDVRAGVYQPRPPSLSAATLAERGES